MIASEKLYCGECSRGSQCQIIVGKVRTHLLLRVQSVLSVIGEIVGSVGGRGTVPIGDRTAIVQHKLEIIG
jgi:hypothetical protein